MIMAHALRSQAPARPVGAGGDVATSDAAAEAASRRGMPRFLRAGGVGSVPVGDEDDPLEREAEAFAHAVTGREHAAPASLRRESEVGHAPGRPREPSPAGQQPACGDDGRPLSPAIRIRLEGSTGADLGGVRVHAGVDAGHAAAALRARAFTFGDHVWLGRGKADDDLGLMAHEVAHVVQQRGGASARQDEGVSLSAEGPVVRRWGEDPSSPDEPGVSGPAASFDDPDAVDVEELTNAELIDESLRAAEWLASAPPETSEESESWHRLDERLRGERALRAEAGHEWLGDVARETPTELYQLVPGVEGLTSIVSIDPSTALSAMRETPVGPIMTYVQYRQYLADHSIPEVDEETFRSLAAQALPLTAWSTPLPPEMPIPYGTAAEGWVARLYCPEAVTLPRAYPAFDLVSGGERSFDLSFERMRSGPLRGSTITVVNESVVGGDWVSVKMVSDPASATTGHIERVVSDALDDMANLSGAIRDPHAVDTATYWRMGRASPQRAILHILVPAEAAAEVPALQAAAESRLAATDYGPGGLPPEVEVRVTAWNPRPPGTAAAGPPLPGRPALGPGGSLALGAGTGGVIAIAVAGGWMLFDAADHPDWEAELARQGGTGVLAGGAQVTIEQAVLAGGARFAPGVGVEALRVAGRGLGAGVVSGGLEIYGMANEPREHGTAESIVRPARAAALGWSSTEIGLAAGAATVAPATGAVAVIMTSAGYGAAAGSVAPGVGTAIGFIVGIGVGIGAYYLLNEITPGGREDWE